MSCFTNFSCFHSQAKELPVSLSTWFILLNLVNVFCKLSSARNLFIGLSLARFGSDIFMSLQWILMKLCPFSKFGMKNWSIEAVYCLLCRQQRSKYQKINASRNIQKRFQLQSTSEGVNLTCNYIFLSRPLSKT